MHPGPRIFNRSSDNMLVKSYLLDNYLHATIFKTNCDIDLFWINYFILPSSTVIYNRKVVT